MTEQDEQKTEGQKLDEKLTRLGLPAGRRGDARDRAELFGTTPAVVRQWIVGRYRVPAWVWNMLKLWELLPAERREQFRRWVRERRR